MVPFACTLNWLCSCQPGDQNDYFMRRHKASWSDGLYSPKHKGFMCMTAVGAISHALDEMKGRRSGSKFTLGVTHLSLPSHCWLREWTRSVIGGIPSMQEVDAKYKSSSRNILCPRFRGDRIHHADRSTRSHASHAAQSQCFGASRLHRKPLPHPTTRQRLNRSALCPAFCRPRSQT